MKLVKCRHCFRCYPVDVDTVMIVCPVCMETVYDVDRDERDAVELILWEATRGNYIE